MTIDAVSRITLAGTALLVAFAMLAAAGCDGEGAEPGKSEPGKSEPGKSEPGKSEPAASCSAEDQPVAFSCSDKDGHFKCCLSGCLPKGADAAGAIAGEALSLLDGGADAIAHESAADGQCVTLAPKAGEGDAKPSVAARLDMTKVPTVEGKAAKLDGAAMVFSGSAWWCSSERAEECKKLVAGPEVVKVLLLQEHDLMRSEKRVMDQCAKNMKGKGHTVEFERVTQAWRKERLSAWLDAQNFGERNTIGIDEAVLGSGVAVVVRWLPPKVKKRRGKTKRKTQGTRGVGVVRAAPGQSVREYAWLSGEVRCEDWLTHKPWLKPVVTRAIADETSEQVIR